MLRKLFNWYNNQIANEKHRMYDDRLQLVKERANELFQICEYKNKIWLTYNEHLICPIEMMGTDAVETLGRLRNLYVIDVCGYNENKKENDDVVLQG